VNVTGITWEGLKRRIIGCKAQDILDTSPINHTKGGGLIVRKK